MEVKRARYNAEVRNMIEMALDLLGQFATDAITEAARGAGHMFQELVTRRLEEINEFLKMYNRLAMEAKSDLPIIKPVEISGPQPLDELVKEALEKLVKVIEALLQTLTS